MARNRHDKGINPVKIAVLAAIFDQPLPRITRFDGPPQVLERGGRHIRMAHQVMIFADQFVTIEAGNGDEGVVGVGNGPFQVRFGHKVLAFGEGLFDRGHR